MDAAWVVVADSARARIFRAETRVGPLEEFQDLSNSSARLHDGDLYTGEQTRRYEFGGPNATHQTNDYEPPRSHEDVINKKFAKEVAEYLRRGAQENRYERLVVAAGPQFLGVLRNEMDPKIRERVTLELSKDLSKMRPEEVRSYLPERF